MAYTVGAESLPPTGGGTFLEEGKAGCFGSLSCSSRWWIASSKLPRQMVSKELLNEETNIFLRYSKSWVSTGQTSSLYSGHEPGGKQMEAEALTCKRMGLPERKQPQGKL